jgi:plastocyanin/ribosomal protein L37AE/L43A
MSEVTSEVIAISITDHEKFGCPSCGYRSGYTPISRGGSALWICGDGRCRRSCCILADDVTSSTISIGGIRPRLVQHPRRDIPSHGRPDKQPEGGGEFFHSRGTGLDVTPGCFVCGGYESLCSNIAAFVQCKEAGERVVAMFSHGARIDYREYEPDRVQVKVGACAEHRHNLERLHSLVADGVLTSEKIAEATSLRDVAKEIPSTS